MIYLGADHRGLELKEKIGIYLQEKGFFCEDLGAFEHNPADDFTQFAHKVALAVAKNPAEHKGILICGSGVGVDIAANKIKGIRAGLLFSQKQAKSATYDDAINIAAIPADYVSQEEAKDIVSAFLETPYSKEERHSRRIRQIKAIEDAT